MNIQNGKEEIVKLGARHRLTRYNFDFTLHGRVYHDCGAGYIGYKLNEFLNIGVFKVYGELLAEHRFGKQQQQAHHECDEKAFCIGKHGVHVICYSY